MLYGKEKRSNRFCSDPSVTTGSALLRDYLKSGYDKGHLCPAADMTYSSVTMRECFYMSNMSPQESGFNRGIWKRLEEHVRDWAYKDSLLYVVTGAVLIEPMKTIGKNKVAIPKRFYKIILEHKPGKDKAIAFIIPNSSCKKPLKNYIVTIDSVEAVTG